MSEDELPELSLEEAKKNLKEAVELYLAGKLANLMDRLH